MTPIARAGFHAHSLLPVHRRRLAEARRLIAEALARSTRPYIAYSTGKDSTCLAHLVWQQDPTVPAVYFDAACAFPESTALIDRLIAAGRPLTRFPCEPFLETLARAGGPDAPGCEDATMRSTVYEPSQALVAAYGYDCVFVGLRAEESSQRRLNAICKGSLYTVAYDALLHACPLTYWRYEDVWAFIAANALDYNAEYDTMQDMPPREQRISYWAGETGRSHGRTAWLRRRHPNLYSQYVTLFPEIATYT